MRTLADRFSKVSVLVTIGVSEDGLLLVREVAEGAKEDKSRINYRLFGVMLRPQYGILDLDGYTDDYAINLQSDSGD
jgi:hypothetical protein